MSSYLVIGSLCVFGIIFAVIEIYKALKTPENGRGKEILSTVLIVFSSAVWFFPALDYIWLNFSVISDWSFYLSLTGMVFLVSGIMVRLGGFLYLGKYYDYNIRVRSEHKLVTTGIYRYVRHPLYLGTLLLFTGVPFLTGSLVGFLILVTVSLPSLYYRITVEEKMLVEHFGDSYLNYRAKTPALVPFMFRK
ncbi:MAG: isoprenylcysteine carboxylmethyltransferase family protein [Deltaproteobacteria bacterium]|nr:isoprenylcysteine carboxylmethyltransferase family protein [Deltaproteobacteria bacterium]